MKPTVFLNTFFAVFCLSSLLFVDNIEATNRCKTCEDIQHATNLSAIEKHLMEVGHNSLQELDSEARDWYAKFQKGGMLFDGWEKISKDVVAKVPEPIKVKTEATMLALGVKIGCEWSKDNDIRKISTAMLKSWGKQLRKTISSSPTELPMVISSIESEVDALLF